MNLPFAFTLDQTKIVGLIWGSNAAAPTVAANNTFTPTLFPVTRIIIDEVEVMADLANSEVSIGSYVLSTQVFTALETLYCTAVAGGGIVQQLGGQITIDCTSDIVPAIKLIGSAVSAPLSGRFNVIVTGRSLADLQAALVVANVGDILIEDGSTLNDESDVPLTLDP